MHTNLLSSITKVMVNHIDNVFQLKITIVSTTTDSRVKVLQFQFMN